MQFLSALLSLAVWMHFATAFIPSLHSKVSLPGDSLSSYKNLTTMRKMGLFDGIMKAFENEEYGSRPDAVKATARHILVDSEDEAILLMKKLNSGESSFEEIAKDFSNCPSASDGGSLGTFAPGAMVPEFDKAIFSPKTVIGSVVGPIQTKFGYHLILVEKRSGGGDWY